MLILKTTQSITHGVKSSFTLIKISNLSLFDDGLIFAFFPFFVKKNSQWLSGFLPKWTK